MREKGGSRFGGKKDRYDSKKDNGNQSGFRQQKFQCKDEHEKAQHKFCKEADIICKKEQPKA